MDHSITNTTMISAHIGGRGSLDEYAMEDFLPVPSKVRGSSQQRSWLEGDCDRLMSLFIRQFHKNSCATCGITTKWRQLQNGHYQGRGLRPTRYDIRNCGPQCGFCNCGYRGPVDDILALWLDRYWGDGTAEAMFLLGHSGQGLSSTPGGLQTIRLAYHRALKHYNFNIR